MAALDVAVVGVANMDLVTCVPRLAAEGETTFGSKLQAVPGGKGLNQAVAVARHGGRAALVAQAGDDLWGQRLHATLLAEHVDTSGFALIPGGHTAAVLVQVPASGDSAVTVTRTETTLHTLHDIDRARKVLAAAMATIIQLELDPLVINEVIRASSGVKIGTLAPLRPMPEELYARLDLIVVNAAEARMILGPGSETLDGPELAKSLAAKGPDAAVVTLGPQGAAISDATSAQLIPAAETQARNTTGAGDTLLGVLALNLARAADLSAAVTLGVEAATRHVQRPQPPLEEVASAKPAVALDRESRL